MDRNVIGIGRLETLVGKCPGITPSGKPRRRRRIILKWFHWLVLVSTELSR
jgi:hypothetical protein